MLTELLSLNGQPSPVGESLAAHFPAVKHAEDFCPVCFDKGLFVCAWVTNTQAWKEEVRLNRLRREVQATEAHQARIAKNTAMWDARERSAIRRSRWENPDHVLVFPGIITPNRNKGVNAANAKAQYEAHQQRLRTTFSFGLETNTGPGLEEDLPEVDAYRGTHLVAEVVKAACGMDAQERPPTPKQLRRLRKKNNKALRGPLHGPKRPTKEVTKKAPAKVTITPMLKELTKLQSALVVERHIADQRWVSFQDRIVKIVPRFHQEEVGGVRENCFSADFAEAELIDGLFMAEFREGMNKLFQSKKKFITNALWVEGCWKTRQITKFLEVRATWNAYLTEVLG
jgi:hypothetical protein